MIEHCAPQYSSMYRLVLRTQPEYVVHRSNWTMIDDVTFPSLPLLLVFSPLLPSFFLHLSTSVFFPFPLREGVILRKLNIVLETYNPRGSLYPFLAYSRFLFSSRLLSFSLSLSLFAVSESSPLSSHYFFLSISLFSLSISLYYFDLLLLLILALSRSSS